MRSGGQNRPTLALLSNTSSDLAQITSSDTLPQSHLVFSWTRNATGDQTLLLYFPGKGQNQDKRLHNTVFNYILSRSNGNSSHTLT